MKLKAMIAACVLASGLSTLAQAQALTFSPPERVNCHINAAQKLNCDDFDRLYLMEDTFNADFQHGKEQAFHFASAAAYLSPGEHTSTVFFTYHNSQSKFVKLKTIPVTAFPDLENGHWKKLTNDIYTCDAGYMSCDILIN